MTPTRAERWLQIEDIYIALEDLSEDDRDRRLLAVEPPELAIEVRELFHAIDAEAAAQRRLAMEARQIQPLTPRLAGYELLDAVGSGGAGVVYRGRRLIDHGSPQPVAIKVFHIHRSGADENRRFVRELGIVATLDHPAIVKFFDGGFTADSRPFLVMELVEGLPLTTYCDNQKLDLRKRLELLLAIFHAVSWAHARLVVHLDLKPANILVTAHGTPKLLDFGAAQLLELADDITITQQITPQYASPERLRGEPPTVASDVYSLGLLLFEVLSGGWPYLLGDSVIGLADRASHDSPLTPLKQAAAKNHPFRSQLDADLDAICAKALAFNTAERYATVNDLADDVRRFLDGTPVQARSVNLLYRTSKLAARYFVHLALAALFVTALTTAAVYSYIQAQQARRAAGQAERAVTTLQELLSESNFGRGDGGRDMTVKELLGVGAARIAPRLSADPAVGSDFLVVLVTGFIAQQDFKQARAAVEKARLLAEASADDTRRTVVLAASSQVSYFENRPDDAWDEASRALKLWQRRRSAFSTGNSLSLLPQIGFALLNTKPSDPVASEAFTACLQLAPPASQNRAGCLQGLANISILARKNYIEALPMLAEAVAIRRASAPNQVDLAYALQAFGFANRMLERYADDEAAQREALALTTSAIGTDSLQTANCRALWATALGNVGRAELGLAQAKTALTVYRRQFHQTGANLLWTPLSAAMFNACLTNRFTDCEQYAREAIQTLGDNPSNNDSRLFSAQGHLGWALARLGRHREAKPLLSQAIDGYNQLGRRPFTMGQFEAALNDISAR